MIRLLVMQLLEAREKLWSVRILLGKMFDSALARTYHLEANSMRRVIHASGQAPEE